MTACERRDPHRDQLDDTVFVKRCTAHHAGGNALELRDQVERCGSEAVPPAFLRIAGSLPVAEHRIERTGRFT